MIGEFLFFLAATAATFLGLSADAVGATVTKNVDIVVTPSGSSCPCNAGGTPNICLNNPSPAAGSIVNATLVCGPANGDRIGWYNTNMGANGLLFTSHIGGASTITLPLQVPNIASDRPEYWTTYLLNSDGSYGTLTGQSVTVPATIAQSLGAVLPDSVGADPFVPAHIVSVCPAGCDYAHVEDAMAFVRTRSPAWDNVKITIDVADYPYTPGSGNAVTVSWNFPNTPAHIWFKGIIGRSGTDGTVFPRFFTTSPLSNPIDVTLFSTIGPYNVWVDNIEFGPSNGWISVLNAQQTTLRNVYIHDGKQGMLSGDAWHHDLYVYNSHFARNGGGAGPEHNLYAGKGDDADTLVIKNSIFEQAYNGHDVKTRASQSTLTCDKLLLNQDWAFEGSEVVDASEGRILRVYDSLLVNGGGGAPAGAFSWNDNQSFDHIRFGADHEFVTLPNVYIDLQGSTLISDGGFFHFFLNLRNHFTPSPPYPAGNVRPNTFVFLNAAQQNPGAYSPNYDNPGNSVSALAIGYPPGSEANDINFGTIGTTNFVYPDRASAGYPALGTYPKGYTNSAFPAMPAACTEWVGRVKVPAN